MGSIIDGKMYAQKVRDDLTRQVKNCMIKPSLAVIQIKDKFASEASDIYIRNKEKAASEIGINFRHFLYEDGTSEREIINKIIELNNDEYVDGIIVQLPLPESYSTKRILNTIDVNKDVDGLTDKSCARLYNDRKGFLPCTPSAVLELLNASGVEIQGKHVVIVGRSNLVGRPLATMLLRNDATVTVAHSCTEDLKSITLMADILIVATGHRGLITADMVKEGVVVIDVGISRKDGKIYGDVQFDEVKEKASLITPVPGGVGPMTVAILFKNVIECYKNKSISK